MPWQNPLVSVLWLMLSASVSLTKNGFSTWIHLRIKNTAWTFLPIFVCFFLFKNVKAFVNTFSAFIFLPYSLGHSPSGQDTADANLQKLTQLVNKESNLIEKVTLLQSPYYPAALWLFVRKYSCNCTMNILFELFLFWCGTLYRDEGRKLSILKESNW